MATSELRTYSLFLAVVLWGTLLGGILYSHLIYFPVYLSNLPDSAVVVTGPYGLRESIFWLTIHPLTILSLIVALALNWRFPERRKLILITFVLYIVVLVITQAYFLPELMAFERSPGSGVTSEEWLVRGRRWQRLSWMRGAIMYAGILPLLLALTKPISAPQGSETAAPS